MPWIETATTLRWPVPADSASSWFIPWWSSPVRVAAGGSSAVGGRDFYALVLSRQSGIITPALEAGLAAVSVGRGRRDNAPHAVDSAARRALESLFVLELGAAMSIARADQDGVVGHRDSDFLSGFDQAGF